MYFVELMDLIKIELTENQTRKGSSQLTVTDNYLLDTAKLVRSNVLSFMDAGKLSSLML